MEGIDVFEYVFKKYLVQVGDLNQQSEFGII